jgi:hypothetical protein
MYLLKNAALLTFVFVVIIEYLLLKSWWEDEVYERHKSWERAPYVSYRIHIIRANRIARYYFWYRIGIALILDLFFTAVSLFLILNPLHHSKCSFHPAFALVVSIFMFGLYVAACAVNVTLVAANKIGFHNMDLWYRITYAEDMCQGALALGYFSMLGYSCMAVHEWRMARKLACVELSMANRQAGEGSML